MSKSVKEMNPGSAKKIQSNEPVDYVIQKIARIDGHQTVKKYKKMQLLGKGGFANCYITQNAETKKRAATKIIQKELLTSQKTKLRLLNEIRLHKTLHHENIVEFFHYFEDKNNVYIFLELCQNQSLNEVIRTRQSFSTPQIQSFIYGIVKGLKYLHSKSIIHRDLKLGNIFLDKKFNIKLGDFGLATKLQFRKQCKRTICGTPNYIAPQILQGKGYHFEIDIWSIGVILYTLYYTIPPFETDQAITTYQKIKKCDYTIPKYGLVPNQAIDLIQKILVKNPWQRPTLDDILNSDFMKLGNKIYKQLPSYSNRKIPAKKDFMGLPFWTHDQIMKENSEFDKLTKSQQKSSSTKDDRKDKVQYIVDFENLGEGRYFYVLNNDTSSIWTENEIIYKDEYGAVKSFNPNSKVKIAKSCEQNPLKHLLNCKTKLLSSQQRELSNSSMKQKQKEVLFEATLYPTEIPLYIKKISQQPKYGFSMLRLSNQTIQFVFDDGVDFVVSGKGDLIYEIKNKHVFRLIELSQNFELSSQQQKTIDQKKIKFLNGVLSQIKGVKQKIQSKGHSGKENCAKIDQNVNKFEKQVNREESGLKKQLGICNVVNPSEKLFKEIKH